MAFIVVLGADVEVCGMRCRAEVRFDVLVREGMYQQAMGILMAAARENPQGAYEALRKGLDGLTPLVLVSAAQQPNGIVCGVWSVRAARGL